MRGLYALLAPVINPSFSAEAESLVATEPSPTVRRRGLILMDASSAAPTSECQVE